MATPPEGPALERDSDTTLDGEGIAHDRTLTPPTGDTSVSLAGTGLFPGRVADVPPGTMIGEYKIEGLLGEGGMGRVYSAIHPVIGKRAAVKVLHPRYSANPEVVERFVQEARATNQIGHPNIVDVFAFGELPGGERYFVMEWLKGESLYERMRHRPLTRDEMCHYVADISYALEAAHDKRIVHRDLKPENVFLQEGKGDRRQIKLLDFGIAKLVTEDTRIERTRTGAMMGTPKYIAPEQARGYAVDHRVDIYSLGVMMFEIVAGRLPFEADNAMDLVAMHLHDDAPSLCEIVPGTPHILGAVVSAMLSKDAVARPSLAEVRRVLDEVRALPEGDAAYTVPDLMRAQPAPSSIYTQKIKKRTPLLALALAGGVVAIGGGVAVALLAERSPSQTSEPVPPAAPLTLGSAAPVKAPEIDIKAPTPTPPPKPEEERVTLVTTGGPATGELWLDGASLGEQKTPIVLKLPVGDHEFELRPKTGKPVAKKFKVVAGISSKIELAIPAPPRQPPKQQPRPPRPPTQPVGEDDFIDPKKQ
jgi:eukaryotic-like serine/threonine-protein kinase